MLHIVMDSAGDMPEGWAQEYNINIIPINIQFGERTYLQGIDLSTDDFYRAVERNHVIPKTSQPSPQQFINFYRKIAKAGEQILSIHVTGRLSGTFDSASMAAKELKGELDVFPVDSASGSAAMGYMCKEARLLERSGAPLGVILDRMNFIQRNVSIILTLDTLEYARMSGRVKALQAALASILNVKPIILLKEGMLDMADRVRTRRRALDYVIESMRARFGDRKVNVAVVHAQDPESAKSLLERVPNWLHCKELILTELSIAVAANLGPGTVGMVVYPVEG